MTIDPIAHNKRQLQTVAAPDNFSLSRVEIEVSERVKDYVRASSSEATLKAYKSDLEHFVAWGGDIPASPELVANYLAEHAGMLGVTTSSKKVGIKNKRSWITPRALFLYLSTSFNI